MKKIYLIFSVFILFSCEYFYPPEVYETLSQIESSVSSANPLNPLKGIFVSISKGNDANTGTNINEPVKNINVAIERARTYGMTNIYVEAGIYTVANGGLSYSTSSGMPGFEGSLELVNVNGINLIGGWNSEFTYKAGKSILDNQNDTSYKRVLYISNSISNTIDGFEFIHTSNDSYNYGAGAFIYQGTNIFLTNCVIRNNYTPSIEGCALYMSYSLNCKLYVDVISNTPQNVGSIIFISMSSSNYFKGNIIENDSSYSSSPTIFKLHYSTNNTINCLFSDNGKDHRLSSILLLSSSSKNIIKSRIMNNICSNYIIQLDYANDNTISGEIINNELKSDGYFAYCIKVLNGESNIINDLVITNNLVLGTENLSSIIFISKNYNLALPVYLISNCIIGNSEKTECGIYEGGGYDLTGHILKDNKFFNNFNSGFYYNNGGVYINEIQYLNDTAYTGASEASGNVIFNP